MTDIVATDVTGVEALKLVQRGQQLKCPKCDSIIETVPKNGRNEMPSHGREYPKEQKHYMIECEDEKTM